jgi:hypothetical protein
MECGIAGCVGSLFQESMTDINKIIEYVDGEKVAHRFGGLTIPVIEYNEAIPYIRELMIQSFKHGKSFGQHLKADDYVNTILPLENGENIPRRQA